jgi:hypothetical protein
MDIFKMQGPFPKNCVINTCKAPFYKEDIKGHIPHFAITTLVFCKCHKCGAIHKIKVPAVYVQQWIDTLPERPPISIDEIAAFHKQITTGDFMQSLREETRDIEFIYEDMIEETDELYGAIEDDMDDYEDSGEESY